MLELTFEQAITATENLLSRPDISPAELESALKELLQSMDGARGFWVTYLTGDWELQDHSPC